MADLSRQEELEKAVFGPLTHTSRWWYLWVLFLALLLGFGFWAYSRQLGNGLAVTGMGDTVVWGLYISNFVFFSGVSMAGTFISAILRITGAEWRRPLTRIAELTTVSALTMCGLMPAVDMGRPDRLLNLVLHGRLESPLIWDVLVIPTYLTASLIYLYLFLIPDSAVLRDRLAGKVSKLRHRFYSLLSLGWQGLPEQRRRLERAGLMMMLIVIPIGVATHSVVSWIFGMTYRAGWDSTIFAPYFAVGALYSGTAMLITIMFIFRRLQGLQDYFTEKHFRYLGYIMVAFGLLYLYFTFAEYLSASYKLEGGEKLLLQELFFGRYAWLVWPGFVGGQVIPIVLAANPRTNTMPVLFVASLLVNVGMFIKRFVIVVPSLSLPLMPYSWGTYTPTWVEVAITVASFAGFALIITLFAKLFPIISVSEMEEGWGPVSEMAGPAQATGLDRPGRLEFEPGSAGHD
jgi:molybdopterin-containing oxidoreductase family membrane subunit